ncbi:MAG: chromate resistance protein [Betaproteobacteria bacterium]|nr:chromate resistance protein [Betaproteobacteria bacterium]
MKWITRERPKIDRIACPWLVARFIDREAEFLYVPRDKVMSEAQRLGATPFDVPGVELGHDGPYCSFDAFIGKYKLNDPALHRLALIVRGADTDAPDLAPEAAGLVALSWGLNHNFQDDHELLAQGMAIYDALYTWCAAEAGRQ